MSGDVAWTDDRIEVLKRLWAEGLSSSQIAGELGGVSRSAVIGKLHRLGLTGKKGPSAPRAARPRKPRVSTPMFRPARPMVRGNTALAEDPRLAYDAALPPEPDDVDNVIPLGQRCTLLELNDDKCRWPIGDVGEPGFFFCGGKTTTGCVYCGYHARIAYAAPAARRDRRPARG